MSGFAEKHKVIFALRKHSERYIGSNNPHTMAQGQTLQAIADCVYQNDIEDALIRYDALHSNIKSSLPFFVLDYFDRAEDGLMND